MDLVFESPDHARYLEASDVVDFLHPAVRALVEELRAGAATDEERARLAFTFARDQIRHSFDQPEPGPVTIRASETLERREGICFAKAHLLTALLRGLGLPAGFSYQRVVRKGTPESGHALHGLNAFYLPARGAWFRLDPRGNKPGVQAEFDLEHERLAYPIREGFGELDYPWVLARPDAAVLAAMHRAKDSRELFDLRPEALTAPR